jgi:hypothetical protein
VKVLEISPPKGPDLNPNERLWSNLGQELVTAKVKTEDEMFAEVERVWIGMVQDMMDRPASASFWRRRGLRQSMPRQDEMFADFESVWN